MHAAFARLRGVSLLALLALVLASLRPDAALAQQAPGPPDRVFSAGPLQMQDGQSVAFGMLLPAVQKARSAALFTLTDSQGTTLFTVAPTPGRLSTIRVTFHAAGSAARVASFEVSHGIGNPDFVPAAADGILIGLLLPAVNRSGQSVGPLSASMQSFNAAGATMTHTPLVSWIVPGSPD